MKELCHGLGSRRIFKTDFGTQVKACLLLASFFLLLVAFCPIRRW